MVARTSTVRLLIALTSFYNIIIHQMDVKIVFLNSELEEVYMEQPKVVLVEVNCSFLVLNWRFLDEFQDMVGEKQFTSRDCVFHSMKIEREFKTSQFCLEEEVFVNSDRNRVFYAYLHFI